MKLPMDVALCDGVGKDECADCLRRTAERPDIHWKIWPSGDGRCEAYMEPRYTITEAGRAMLRDAQQGER